MPNVIRVALPGYDALTDTDTDHFALYSDQDNVLIKEYDYGSNNITAGQTINIHHNLGYVPLYFVYVYDQNGRADANATSNKWKLVASSFALDYNVQSPFSAQADSHWLAIVNNDSTTTPFHWYIFYDQQV